MNAAGRLASYATGLAVVFGGSFAAASAVVPDSASAEWRRSTAVTGHPTTGHPTTEPTTSEPAGDGAALPGLSQAQDGYVLSPVSAPAAVGAAGDLSFQVLNPTGAPLVDYTRSHEEDLHLIVVRSDGTGFRHVHPALDPATGTWSLPWTWDAAGTYRVFADFTPAEGSSGLTLTRTLDVAGAFTPTPPTATSTRDEAGGFTATLQGSLTNGTTRTLELSISRDGQPVTTLQPYLGAFGHLVALRQGDLAYLHVHPEGESPASATDTSGPVVAFAAEAPTAGRYLLYLDFQVDGEVHTAEFALDVPATGGPTTGTAAGTTAGLTGEHGDHSGR
ncbi:heavy-metal-associated domain-containing protein [Kineococcus sp. SYSU DK006]|uniref:heavy-metal-associated domain-containing protein n=1 Tax=Kineococcus sp. SYSU DK006 TaxID=3383127 RepID=UPI003D7D6B93